MNYQFDTAWDILNGIKARVSWSTRELQLVEAELAKHDFHGDPSQTAIWGDAREITKHLAGMRQKYKRWEQCSRSVLGLDHQRIVIKAFYAISTTRWGNWSGAIPSMIHDNNLGFMLQGPGDRLYDEWWGIYPAIFDKDGPSKELFAIRNRQFQLILPFYLENPDQYKDNEARFKELEPPAIYQIHLIIEEPHRLEQERIAKERAARGQTEDSDTDSDTNSSMSQKPKPGDAHDLNTKIYPNTREDIRRADQEALNVIQSLTGTIPDLPTADLLADNGIEMNQTSKRKTADNSSSVTKKAKTNSTSRETGKPRRPSAVTQSDKRYEALKEEHNQLKANYKSLERVEKTLNSELTNLETIRNTLQLDLMESETANRSQKERLDELEKFVDTLKADMSKLETENGTLKADLSNLETKYRSELENLQTTHQSELDNLVTNLRELAVKPHNANSLKGGIDKLLHQFNGRGERRQIAESEEPKAFEAEDRTPAQRMDDLIFNLSRLRATVVFKPHGKQVRASLDTIIGQADIYSGNPYRGTTALLSEASYNVVRGHGQHIWYQCSESPGKEFKANWFLRNGFHWVLVKHGPAKGLGWPMWRATGQPGNYPIDARPDGEGGGWTIPTEETD